MDEQVETVEEPTEGNVVRREKPAPREVLKVLRYKGPAPYEVRTELVKGDEFGMDDFEMRVAYTPDGKYIGDPKTARNLCVKRGIFPELASPDHNVCSIGWAPEANKWYGWSRRAIYGFTSGDVVKEGDICTESLPVGFKAETFEDAKKMAIAFADCVS